MIDAPFAIIIGAMKCGTSTLFGALARHPEIIGSSDKEPGFFSFPDVYERGIAWYLDLWEDAGSPHEDLIHLEASTHYTKEPDIASAAPLAKKHLRNVRFLYVVRDPVKRVESQANFDRMRGRLLGECKFLDRHIVDVTRYMKQLRPYIDLFGKERLLVIDFDDFVRRPAPALRDICKFLGVDSDFQFEPLAHSNKTNSGTDKYQQLRKWAGYYHKPWWVRAGIRVFGVPLCLWRIQKERMSNEQKSQVLERLGDDIREFHEEFSWYPLDHATLAPILANDPPLSQRAPADHPPP